MASEEIIRISEIINKAIVRQEALTKYEQTLLDEWLGRSEENRAYYQDYSPEKEYAEFDRVVAISSQPRQWERLEKRIDARRRNLIIRQLVGYAAAVAVVVGVATVVLHQSPEEKEPQIAQSINKLIEPMTNKAVLVLADGHTVEIDGSQQTIEDQGSVIKVSEGQVLYETTASDRVAETQYNTIRVPRKGMFSMELADGTKVFLNPGSEMRYPVSFDGATREVTLSGEAHFEVAHNPRKPFLVHAGDKSIKVLGTSFVVSAYADDPFNSASLLSGSVEVSNADRTVTRKLSPGSQAVWKDGGRGIAIEPFNVEHLKLLREGVIILEETDLRQIMRMLSRWFDVDVDYKADTTVNHSITVRFTRQENLQEILDRITRVGGPDFRIEGSAICIY